MTLKKTFLAALLIVLQLLACGAYAAVVPDGDNLPQDVGAPALPGGRRDAARTKSAKVAASASPSAASTTPTPAVLTHPGGPGHKGGDPGKSPTPKRPADTTSSSSWVGLETPSPSYYLLGVILVVFIAWVGWKSRRGERED